MDIFSQKRDFAIFCVALGLTAGCNGQQMASGGQSIISGKALAVWNAAYQENYEADDIQEIQANARDAYVLLDPFDAEFEQFGAKIVAEIKNNGNQLAAYMSVGTGEDWRDDFQQLKPHLVERQWGEWPGEYFISDINDQVFATMRARIDFVAELGFDWIEFDNMDWGQDDTYRARYGIQASPSDTINYYHGLCSYVHSRGMKCMAKSTVEDAGNFDCVTYESYPDEKSWWDEDAAVSFKNKRKLIIIIHYDEHDCDGVYRDYQETYGKDLSFICEDPQVGGYVHFNR